MHAEVISIGDELTSGQRLDTNSQWISQQLGDIGVVVAEEPGEMPRTGSSDATRQEVEPDRFV